MIRLYDNHLSGNGYKPHLLLAHLGQSYERVEIDILKGESRTPEFLAMNPNGRIPLLRLDDGTCLAESNAILTRSCGIWPRSPAFCRPIGWPGWRRSPGTSRWTRRRRGSSLRAHSAVACAMAGDGARLMNLRRGLDARGFRPSPPGPPDVGGTIRGSCWYMVHRLG